MKNHYHNLIVEIESLQDTAKKDLKSIQHLGHSSYGVGVENGLIEAYQNVLDTIYEIIATNTSSTCSICNSGEDRIHICEDIFNE